MLKSQITRRMMAASMLSCSYDLTKIRVQALAPSVPTTPPWRTRRVNCQLCDAYIDVALYYLSSLLETLENFAVADVLFAFNFVRFNCLLNVFSFGFDCST